MGNPSSILRRVVHRSWRPSPALAVAGVALFLALGGAGYAATNSLIRTRQIHNWAVTNAKIANNAVTFRKIKPGSVGVRRIVKSQVQLRLQNSCPAGQAISAVDVNGKVTCTPITSTQTTTTVQSNTATVYNTTAGSPVAVNSATTAATVSSLSLAAGSAYLVQANPYITVTPSTNSGATAQHVVVTCKLEAGTSTTAIAQRSASFDLPAAGNVPAPQVQTTSIPLTVVAPSSASAITATLTCLSSATATSGSAIGQAATDPATVTAQGATYAGQFASATTSGAASPTNPAP